MGGSWLVLSGQDASVASAFADDYLRRVVEQEELLGADRRQIASFFARELGVATTPPQVPGLEVKRAMICLMNGRRGGVVEYEGHARQLTYYLIPIGEGERSGLLKLAAREFAARNVSTPAVASERGLGVATWWDGEHQHALVGSLGTDELKRLALLFARSTSRL
jgi:anti-sigma factor RsiW